MGINKKTRKRGLKVMKIEAIVKVSTNGQITIPFNIRKRNRAQKAGKDFLGDSSEHTFKNHF